MDTLTILCMGPDERVFGNSVPVDEINKDLVTKLRQSIEYCTEPEWPRVLLRSASPIKIVWYNLEP